MKEYYIVSDGFFTYYVNRISGEKKLKLDKGDKLIQAEYDDFNRIS
jgi:hypothetical protein